MEGAAEAPINKFLALCKVSRTIACHRTIPDLLHNVAPPLRRVIDFDFLALMLYDALRNVMQVRTLEKVGEGTVALQPGTEFPADRSWAEWLRENQHLGVISDNHQVAHFAEAMQIARVHGVKFLCMLPLSTANKLIGALCLGSGEPRTYASQDLEFLSTLAGQVALAVDNTLKDEEAKKEQKRTKASLQASEGRWRRVFENSAVGVALTDLQGRFETTNAAYQKLVGYTEEELRKVSFLDITTQEFQEQNWTLVKDVLERKRQQFNIEKQYRRKDGSLVWARNNVSMVPGPDGAPRYIMAIVEDISDRKRAEEALRDREEETRLIVETAPDAAVTMDSNGLVRRWNAVAEHMFGWAASEAINRPVSELIIPPQYREAYRRGLQKFFATGEGAFLGKAIEVTALRRDGQEFPVELSVAPAKLGGAWVFNAFVRDVTERKRAESALQEAQAELAHVTRLSTMGEFAASIAHEVNQPLTAIVANGNACLRWLKAKPPDLGEARESVRKVIRDANRAGEVIKGIRGLAKKSTLQLAPLSLNELIAEVIALARGEIQRNRALLTTELTSDLPFALGDRVQCSRHPYARHERVATATPAG